MPRPKKTPVAQGARPIWSGTITFGLVSIPVDLLSAVRARQNAMKLVDAEGHALGRQYRCSKDGRVLTNSDLVRGYETDDGKMVAITDQEFESVAPEMSPDIRLRNFVDVGEIPPLYFEKSYFLAPSGKSATAYVLLAVTMQRSKRAGIGSFVMRGQEYLVAIVSDNGVLRADTLRYADEIRSPADIGLPAQTDASAKSINVIMQEINALKQTALDVRELEDTESNELHELVKVKQKDAKNVIHHADLEAEGADAAQPSAEIIDLTEILRRSLSRRVIVTNASNSEPVSLDQRRAAKQAGDSRAVVSSPTAVAKRKSPKKR